MANSSYTLEYLIGAKTTGSYYANVNRASKSITGMEGTAKRATRVIGAAFTALGLKRVATDVVETYGEFQQSMANTASVANATKSQYKQLEDAARSAGKQTTKTATESADALGYMALAGWDVNKSVKGLMPVLKLAEATQSDLKTTSDLVTDSMSATGTSVDNLGTFLDKVVKLNNKANTSATQSMEALIKSGGAARALHMNFDDLATSIGILANNGKKGAEGGTAMNAILARLATNKAAKKALGELGVQMYDSNKQFVGFEKVLTQLQKKMHGLSTEQQAGLLKDLAGTHYYSQMKYLLDSVETSGKNSVSAWAKLKSSIQDSNGALNSMNKTATSTLPAATERFKSAVDDMKIGTAEVFSGSAINTIDAISAKIPKITEGIEKWGKEHSYDINETVNGIGDGITAAANGAAAFGDLMVKNRGILKGALTAVLSIKTAVFAIEKSRALMSFFSGITPAGKAIALTGLAIGGIVGLMEQVKAHNEDLVRQNMNQHFGNIVLSLEEIKEAADQIVGIDIRDSLNAIDDRNNALKETEQQLKSIRDDIGKTNWKAEVGIDLTKDDIESYKTNVTSLIENTQKWIEDKQYSVDMQVRLLMGDGDNDVSRGVNSYYGSQKKKLAKLGKQLQKAVNDAFEDGFLDFDEEKKLATLEQKISNMQSKLSEAKYKAALDTAGTQYEGQDISASSFKNLQKQVNKATDKAVSGYKKAYETGMTSLYARLEDGNIDQSQFNQERKELYKALLDKQAKTESQSTQFMTKQIENHYKKELGKAAKDAKNSINYQMKNYLTDESVRNGYGDGAQFLADMKNNSMTGLLGDKTAGAINELLEQLEPKEKRLQSLKKKYKAIGEEIPQSITDGLRDIGVLKELTNGSQTSWQTLAEAMKSSPYADELMAYLKQEGVKIPKQLSDAMTASKNGVHSGINSVWSETSSYAKSKFSSGISVTVPFKVTLKDELRKKINKTLSLSDMLIQGNNPNVNITPGRVKANAIGGIYNSPILTTFAEKGPEAAIPLDGTQRAKRLWKEAGARLGMTSNVSKSQTSLSFSPVVNISGSASADDVHRGLQMTYEDLDKMFGDYMRQRQRRSFKR